MNFEFSILNPRRDGFTLLEMIIVLTLITLILGLSPVFYANTLPSTKLNATAREISAMIRYARSFAAIRSEPQVLTIDLDAKRYGIEGKGFKNISPEINIGISDPFSGEIHAGTCKLAFQSAGGVPGGTIILWNNKKKIRIELDPVVGSVVIR